MGISHAEARRLWKNSHRDPARKVARNQWCDHCRRRWAEHLHHVIPLTTEEGRRRWRDPTNWRPLCSVCHALVEKRIG